jgi:hypothetical protein
MATKKTTEKTENAEAEVMRVQIFDNIYNYNDLSDDTKKLFILQDDIRRDLAFHHARADASLMYIRTNLEKLVKNETPIGVAEKGTK